MGKSFWIVGKSRYSVMRPHTSTATRFSGFQKNTGCVGVGLQGKRRCMTQGPRVPPRYEYAPNKTPNPVRMDVES